MSAAVHGTPGQRELAAMLRSARGLAVAPDLVPSTRASSRAEPLRARLTLFSLAVLALLVVGRPEGLSGDSAYEVAGIPHGSHARPFFKSTGDPVRSHESQEEDGMRSLRALAASSVGVGSIMAGGLSGSALAQDAVQWRIEDGGNGHWYAVTLAPKNWSAARALALSLGGDLASIESRAEMEWLDLELTGERWPNQTCHIGGRQDPGSPSVSSGWRWLSGDLVDFSQFDAYSFDDWPGGGSWGHEDGEQDYLHAGGFFRYLGDVNDVPWPPLGSPDGASLIEWSADCNSDGIVDYGQLRAGELVDINANNTPDCCEQGFDCRFNAVEWSVKDGGNGHWYAVTLAPMNWSAARDLALSLGGDLASIESRAEMEWLDLELTGERWPNQTCHIGGRQDPGSPSVSSGWRWLSGDLVDFSQFDAYSFDDWPGGGSWGYEDGEQDYLHAGGFFRYLGDVNDVPWPPLGSPDGASLVEWSADCNADGIVDYGQIRAGELADTNANNIPDCCEATAGCNPCLADIDESGVVNAVDLAAILTVWGTSGGKYPRADINNDGEVNGPDLAAVLSAWGPCP